MPEPEPFLKRHGFLIAGVALPLLVVLGFLLARTLPRLWVADPRFDLLYVVRHGNEPRPGTIDRSLSVVDGHVRVRWTRLAENAYFQPAHLYRFHAASGAVEEISLPESPGEVKLEAPVDGAVPGFDGFRVVAGPAAPDGYAFETRSNGGSGIFGEVFGHGYRPPQAAIGKGGRVILLPRTEGELYGSWPVEFLGWLVPGEAGR